MRVLHDGDSLLLRYRIYYRKGSHFKTYVAQIVGPHPNYYLQREFLMRSRICSHRFETFTYSLADGIYELVIKRFDDSDNLLSRERKWLVVFDGHLYEYAEDEMNYLYVLYAVFLLRLQSADAA